MNIMENILIVVGLSLNIFLIGQYEGSMIRNIEWKKIAVICVIIGTFETFSMMGGYLITLIPFFEGSSSLDLRKFCYFIAALLFLLIAFYMVYKSVRRTPIQERLREIGYKRIFLEGLLIFLFTFIAGIGWGFIGRDIVLATCVIACSTVLAAITGIYMGYNEGCVFRYGIYGIGGAMFVFVGVDILVRYV